VGASDNNLYAINPNGSQKWAFPTVDTIHSSPVIDFNEIIYFAAYSGDNNFYAIEDLGPDPVAPTGLKIV